MSNSQHLRSSLQDFHTARVLCIGDVMLDRFVYGRVERVSAEAPVQILHVDSARAMLGGVGNVARNVVALGARAVLIAVTGDDAAAREITELAASEGRLTPLLIPEVGRPSTVKTRYSAEAQQLLRTDEESTLAISDDTARKVIAAIESELERADVMIISDYTKGLLTDEVLATAIAMARAAGVPVVADPKRANFEAYAGVTILKPNRSELAIAARLHCEEDDEVEACAHKVMNECGIAAMMVSRSERGLSLVPRDFKAVHFDAKALEVFDVSGAGDTVVATTAVALASGAGLADAAEVANVAGGIVVAKSGTAVVDRQELTAALLAAEGSPSRAKIMTAEAAVESVESWRKRGLRVGFTNGCFDLLHPGHISLLSEAKAGCDRLIVGLNSDKSVRRLKGVERPIQSEIARAVVLASLSQVDLVVVFTEDTPIALIELLTPDLLVKGGDYAIDDVVGADVVLARGGEVKLAALVPGHSSSEVVSRISGRRDLSDA